MSAFGYIIFAILANSDNTLFTIIFSTEVGRSLDNFSVVKQYKALVGKKEVREVITDDRDTDVMKFTDLITLRQFKGKANWKDNKGGYGVVECMGNHTIFKNKKTLLKMYCKEINKSNDNFVLMFDRNSENFSAGVGESTYIDAIGKSIPGEQYCLSSLPLSNQVYDLKLGSVHFKICLATLSLKLSPFLEGKKENDLSSPIHERL